MHTSALLSYVPKRRDGNLLGSQTTEAVRRGGRTTFDADGTLYGYGGGTGMGACSYTMGPGTDGGRGKNVVAHWRWFSNTLYSRCYAHDRSTLFDPFEPKDPDLIFATIILFFSGIFSRWSFIKLSCLLNRTSGLIELINNQRKYCFIFHYWTACSTDE